jgi:hypothetical protein
VFQTLDSEDAGLGTVHTWRILPAASSLNPLTGRYSAAGLLRDNFDEFDLAPYLRFALTSTAVLPARAF